MYIYARSQAFIEYIYILKSIAFQPYRWKLLLVSDNYILIKNELYKYKEVH